MHLALQGESVDLGSIQMVSAVKSLAEVKVTAARPMVEQQGDRLIYNVEEDPAAKTESASDILRKTPYVTVDGDGGIQVNGQSNFRVLLNGRETAMFSQNVKEALKGFPGANISKIEVITSPSAKYDAEGVGGIINIITKKKLAGYNGTINSNISTLGHRGGGFNMNLKTGKLGITGMYNHMTNGGILSHQVSVTTPVQQFAFARRQVGGTKDNEMYFHNGNLELSYDIDSTNTLVVYGNIGRNKIETFYLQSINTLFSNGVSDISPYFLETNMATPTYGFGTDFIRKFKGKPQKEFT
jgi:outer membrane receptor for ferrienterochelin and colicin